MRMIAITAFLALATAAQAQQEKWSLVILAFMPGADGIYGMAIGPMDTEEECKMVARYVEEDALWKCVEGHSYTFREKYMMLEDFLK